MEFPVAADLSLLLPPTCKAEPPPDSILQVPPMQDLRDLPDGSRACLPPCGHGLLLNSFRDNFLKSLSFLQNLFFNKKSWKKVLFFKFLPEKHPFLLCRVTNTNYWKTIWLQRVDTLSKIVYHKEGLWLKMEISFGVEPEKYAHFYQEPNKGRLSRVILISISEGFSTFPLRFLILCFKPI